jgi:hypothetical protein
MRWRGVSYVEAADAISVERATAKKDAWSNATGPRPISARG